MQTKSLILLLLIAGVAWYMFKPKSRAEKIDYLNLNYGNFAGVWVKMTPDELDASYKVIRLIKNGLKPNDTDALRFQEIVKKYNINQ